MQTVQPPPPPPPATTAVAQPNPAVAPAVNAPPTLVQMMPGQTLQATQSSQTAQALPANQIQVQTTLGPMTLQIAMPVPKDAVLTLTLITLSPQPAFLISELNGKPVPAAQGALKNDAVLGPAQPAKAHPPQPLTQGARVNATLVRPAISTPSAATQIQPHANGQTAQPAPQATPAPVQPGGTVQAAPPQVPTPSASSPTIPSQVSTPATNAATPTTQSSTPASAPATPQAAPASNTSPQVILPSGTRITLSIVRLDPPNAALSTPTPPATGGLTQGTTLTGTITGTTPQGQPIVQTPTATFAINAQSSLSIGTNVVFKLETAPLLPQASINTQLGRTGPADTLVQARAWSDLDDGLKALAQVDPSRFQQVAQNALPQPGAKLSSQMLFFLNALKGGDFAAWLGENATRLIDRERPGLVNRLSGDFPSCRK